MRFNSMILGYKLIGLNEKDCEKVLTALLRRRICASYSHGVLKVPISRLSACLKVLSGMEYEDLGSFGIIPSLCRVKRRVGALSAAIAVMIYMLLASGEIFDIRVRGNEEMSVEEVEEELSRVGVFVGGSFRSLSLSEVETKLLSSSDKIGWININRRGSVAYVEIREKRTVEDNKDTGYSNIVAREDCVIEQITVKSGFAAVEVGDTVRRGDLLISGILPAEAGGGFVNADGVVIGRVYDENTVFVSRAQSVEERESVLPYTRRVIIFNFSVNIFKKYRNYADDCVIIEDTKQLYLFGKYRLPISIVTEHVVKYRTNDVVYSDAELVKLAEAELSEARAKRLKDSEIIALSTVGNFTEDGYELTDKASIKRDVGDEKYFYN